MTVSVLSLFSRCQGGRSGTGHLPPGHGATGMVGRGLESGLVSCPGSGLSDGVPDWNLHVVIQSAGFATSCGVSVLKETVKLIFINFKFFNLEVTGKVEQKANNHRVCISRKVSSHCPRLWKHLDWVNGRDVLISQSRNHCFTWNCCFFLQFLLGAQSSPSPVTSVKKPEDWWLPRQICVTSLARPECNRAPDCPMCWAFKACCLPRVFSLSVKSE